MIIGVPKEIKKHEYRVGLIPKHAANYVAHGHTVFVQVGAGIGAGFSDQEYLDVGCHLLNSIDQIYAKAEMIIKVKEPLAPEYHLMREGQIIFTYLHLAASKELTEAMLNRKVVGVAYETITDDAGKLPCLKPMSEVAGRLSIQEGAKFLEKESGGRGVLLGGTETVAPAIVVIIGAGGVTGRNALTIALGMQAHVIALDVNTTYLETLVPMYGGRLEVLPSTSENLEASLRRADLVVSGVLVAGAAAPKIIKRDHLKMMKPGAVFVDIAIDQGGSAETSHVTYHDDPVYVVDGIIHYCVGNMPGAVPRTSAEALGNATLPFGLSLADKGYKEAFNNPHLLRGLNVYFGKLTCEPVAHHFDLPFTNAFQLFK
ncbi:MAG TPA: alanine dehydrogenase [Firmicutes bacterium]|jgi:alanine dehydrogenase|nr:alanine dehydrogenase [Bacillota bacterium]